ncbi:hypothetical protein L7F22_040001 [Adiantum nelumboides]|nr:hypothetical protein [Adiantum nelumboides]
MHITKVARALMSEKNMPSCYWAKAASTAFYTMNKTPTIAVHDMTPDEKFTRKKPGVSHCKVFGCIAYVHVPDELRTKLDPKAEKCVLIGYSIEQKGYKCYNSVTHQVRALLFALEVEREIELKNLQQTLPVEEQEELLKEMEELGPFECFPISPHPPLGASSWAHPLVAPI